MTDKIAHFNKVKTIVKKLDVNSSSTIITLYENTGLDTITQQAGIKPISVNGFIKNLKAYAKIGSLPEATLPNFAIDDSDTEKLYKTLNIEWKSARKQLNLYISNNHLTWEPIGSISLLNPAGYPYRIYNLLDLYTDNLALEVGYNGRVGVSVQDVGYGLLTNSDSVTIYGSYVEEVVALENIENIENIYVNNGGNNSIMSNCTPFSSAVNNISSIVLTANNNRKYAAFVNISDNPIFLNLGDVAIENKGIYLSGKGSSYEITIGSGLFMSNISAICPSSTANLSILECT